jgi:general nucleoside transport system permease protein
MRFELERRAAQSRAMLFLSPVMAIAITVLAGAVIFAISGIEPLRGLHVYFISPFERLWSIQELLVKAAPLIIIALGLSLCFQASVWNIGAEGQYTLGAIFGAYLALNFADAHILVLLPAMMIAGMVGGLVWAAIPALLKTTFRANEILTSLMLTYVALLILDYLVRGPWRDPMGFAFPETALFSASATLPELTADGRLHLGVVFALALVALFAVALPTTVKGFEIRVAGHAPKAARFAGFGVSTTILTVFLTSGALAGLAGIAEVSGTVHQLLPTISPGYGFTAIIVAFLGRLNPVGILLAGLVLSLSYIGGELAQMRLGLALDITMVLQGILLFSLLACDTLIYYRLRFVRRQPSREGA